MGSLAQPTCIGQSYLALRKAQRIDYTGLDVAFNDYQFEGEIFAIAVSPYGRIYIGGDFTLTNNNTVRRNIAAFSSSGVLQSWNPIVNGIVKAIAVSSLGDTIYIGGNFNILLAISDTGKAISNWNQPVILGDINAIAISSQTIYVGGIFTINHNNTEFRNAVAVNTVGTIQNWNPLANAIPNTSVNAISISPDNTVIYVGGIFSLGPLFKNVASFNAAGVRLAWFPVQLVVSPNYTRVNALAISSQNIIYIGGVFDIANPIRKNIAAFTLSGGIVNGNPLENAAPNANTSVNAIAISSQNIIHIGGDFTITATTTEPQRKNAVAVDIDGTIQNWNPSPRNISDNLSVVNAINMSNENIYIGGRFNTIDDKPKLNVAKVNELTGKLIRYIDDIDITQFNNYQFEGVINDISIAQNGNIFVVGNFILTELENDDIIRRNAAAFNPNGELLSWNPSPNGEVFAVDASSAIIYIGGSFTLIKNEIGEDITRTNAAAFNANGVLQNWNPSPKNPSNISSNINVIKVIDDIIYMGGSFTLIKNEIGEDTTRTNAAAFNAEGVLQQWNPLPNGEVNAIAGANGIIYIGGSFTNVSGNVSRNNIAAFDVSGVLQQWNPELNIFVNVTSVVHAIAVLNNIIYIGGVFGNIQRNNAAAFDVSGVLQPWNPSPNGVVNSIVVSSSLIYIGGDFETVLLGGDVQQRPNAAAFNVNGVLQDWNSELNGPVTSIAISSLNIYIGGFFTNVNGYINKDSTVEVSHVTGDIINFYNTTETIYKYKFTGAINIIVVLEEIIYVGGSFTLSNIAGSVNDDRTNIAAFNLDEELLDWNPPSPNGVVNTIASLNGIIYIGGDFTTVGNTNVGNVPRNNIAAFNLAGVLQLWNPSPNGVINAIAILNEIIYIGGSFTTVGSVIRKNAAAFDVAGVLQKWNPSPNGAVNTTAILKEIIYIGGRFDRVNANNGSAIVKLRSNAAAFNTNGLCQEWDPSPDTTFLYITTNTHLEVFNQRTNTRMYNILLGYKTELTTSVTELAISPDGNKIYITNYMREMFFTSNISFIDVTKIETYTSNNLPINLKSQLDANGRDFPSSPVFSPDGKFVFFYKRAGSSGNRGIFAINTSTNQIIASSRNQFIQNNLIINMVISRDGTKMYASSFNSLIILTIDTDGTMNDNIQVTNIGANIMHAIMSSDGKKLYLIRNDDNNGTTVVNIFNEDIDQPDSLITFGSSVFSPLIPIPKVFPIYAVISNDGSKLYVVDFNWRIIVINTDSPLPTNHTIITIPATGARIFQPTRLAISSDGAKLYLSLLDSNIIRIIDTTTNTLIDTFETTSSGFSEVKNMALITGVVKTITTLKERIYIGGTFTNIGSNNIPRFNTAAFDISGVLQPWNPSPNGVVNDIVAHKSLLYIGGEFTTVGATTPFTPRINTAAFDISGNVQNWNLSHNSGVNTIAFSRSNMYIGTVQNNTTAFTSGSLVKIASPLLERIGGAIANSIFNDYKFGSGSNVKAIAIQNEIVYIGGSFELLSTASNNTIRKNAAAFDFNGELLDWDPLENAVPIANASVNAIAISSQNIIYIGGVFTINQNINAAAFDFNGELLDWNPLETATLNERVNAISIRNDNLIYIGGVFTITSMNNADTNKNIAAFNNNGIILNFNPLRTADPNESVNAVVISSALNFFIYIGGIFTIGSLEHKNVAKFNSDGELVQDWNPSPNGEVNALSILNEIIYIGGVFTIVNNTTRTNAAAFNNAGDLHPWDPSPSSRVNVIAGFNNIIYIGGSFALLGNISQDNAAAFNVAGDLQTWNPSPNGMVNAIAASSSGIYVGGQFNKINNVDNRAVAKVDSINGKTIGLPATDVALLNYPLDATSTSVYTLVVSPDEDVIYVGGIFSIKDPVSGSPPRRNVAAFSTIDGSMLPWNPSPVMAGNEPSGAVVFAIAIFNKNIYIGGTFQEVHRFNGLGGTARINRSNIAGFTPEGVLLPWNPSPNGNGSRVHAIVGHELYIYFGGIFANVKNKNVNVPRRNAAAFDENGVFQNWQPVVAESVLCMAALRGTIYIGGFDGNDTLTNKRAIGVSTVGITPDTGIPIQRWNARPRTGISGFGAVHSIAIYPIIDQFGIDAQSIIFIGGSFTSVNVNITANRSHVSAHRADNTATLLAWDPSPSRGQVGLVRSIHIHVPTTTTFSDYNLEIRIGGFITAIRNQGVVSPAVTISNTATIGFNSSNGSLASGILLNGNKPSIDDPFPNGGVNFIAEARNRFYWGGFFTIIDDENRFKVGTTDASGNVIP